MLGGAAYLMSLKDKLSLEKERLRDNEAKKLNKGVVEIEDANPTEILDALKQHTSALKKLDTKLLISIKLISELGPIANWTQFMFDPLTGEENIPPVEDGFIYPTHGPDPATYRATSVAGEKFEGKRTGIWRSGALDWHANLNGLDRADGVALQGIKGCGRYKHNMAEYCNGLQ